MAIQITPENAAQYGAGTEFEMDYGAMSANVTAVVTRIEYVAASKWFEASARLWANVTDHDGEIYETSITSIVTGDDVSQIGAHLVKAVASEVKVKSKWAAYEVFGVYVDRWPRGNYQTTGAANDNG